MTGSGTWRAARRVEVPRPIRPLLERLGTIAYAQGAVAYAVGGCVRDWLLGIAETSDVDVTVDGNGIAVAEALAEAEGVSIRTYPAFGTATLLFKRGPLRRLDVAMCRREVYRKPAAYPRVQVGALRDDLQRRDFTINAIALSLNPGLGSVIDPFHGRDDLQGRLLRILYGQSFMDDPSRILRGIRFACRFALRWEPKTARRLRSALAEGALGWLNPGRLQKELELMLAEPNPAACFAMLADLLAMSR